ncbi:MAG: alpha/beta hydrolase [Selenomonadaceae bacterium]|nr:alpha/beta hydrolase [Selenomonadaceae bacterium]
MNFLSKKKIIVALTAVLASSVTCADINSAKAADNTNLTSAEKNGERMIQKEKLSLTKEWDKVFPKSENVNHRKVTFVNRYGITLAADLYEPKNIKGKLPAIAVSGPFGAVKEQSSGLYAEEMANRGFIAIAFDPSFTGESGGYPRYVASPDINTEDFSAAVDFLSTQDNVDSERIGIIGICGFGGFAVNAAAMDTRIKATVASTMYDMSRVTANGYFDYEKDEQTIKKERLEMRKTLNAQRTKDYKNGAYKNAGGVIDPLPKNAPQFVKDYYDYYKTKRGFHPRSLNSNNGWNMTSALSFMNMPLLAYSDEIQGAVLLVHGEKAHSRYFSEDAFKKLKGKNKELVIIPGASHTDLYDKKEFIPFDKLEKFFRDNLK